MRPTSLAVLASVLSLLLPLPAAAQQQAVGLLDPVLALVGSLLGGGSAPAPEPEPGPAAPLAGLLEGPLAGLLGPLGGVLAPVGVTGERPRVVSAISENNVTVVVSFSKAMGDSAADPSHYSIVQESVNPEVGALGVTAAAFVDTSRLEVRLTTRSQNEVTYRVRVSGVKDRFGQALADQEPFGVDPTSATFAGTPPSDGGVDTDGDGLADDEEQLGWPVTIRLADGQTIRREVTSNPDEADTDRDGLDDATEKALVIDPRDDDTDDDGLLDYAEYNEIFSDPAAQDSDGDSISDGLEVGFFSTSAILLDTDGDQIPDGDEINLPTRNPRVADLPKPSLEIGDMNLQLDVRFVEVTSTERRVVDSKTAASTLRQSASKEFTRASSKTIESSQKLAVEAGFSVEVGGGTTGASAKKTFSFKTTAETSFSQSFTSSSSATSRKETQDEYQKSLTSTAEAAQGSNVTREVAGARMQVGVTLQNAGSIAFTMRNLQVTALIQDPVDPTRLTPIATLLPDSEPEAGFSLGPLVPQRGPFIFSNDQIFPNLVEDLMRNPRGLVFRFSNYDITDELGRNFAFTSQDITDRTAVLTIDFGGFDRDGDGQGDDSEILRVATGTGRRVIDTDGDGDVDQDDRPIVFDEGGRQVGITLRDALRSIDLEEVDEAEEPSGTMTNDRKDATYSVIRGVDDQGEAFERVYRVRRTAISPTQAKAWEILTPFGIDRALGLDDVVLTAGEEVTLAFLQDLDQDRLPAVLEYLNNCVDAVPPSSRDTDEDGLDDRFEVLVGWTVNTDRGSFPVRSSCAIADSDLDGLTDLEEAPGKIQRDPETGLILFPGSGGDGGVAPERDDTIDLEPFRVRPDESTFFLVTLADPITDPSDADTDRDGIDDGKELGGYSVCLRGGECPPDVPLQVVSSPEFFDSDGDTASDRVEEILGGNARDPDFENFGDSDGDGLVNVQETAGWEVTTYAVSTSPAVCDSVCEQGVATTELRFSNPFVADTDGDGLADGEEFEIGSNPQEEDTDGDGLTDAEESLGYSVRDLNVLVSDPNDADTDDDKLGDGFEAGKDERFIVRVPGQTPYQAFSNPVDSDTDLDRLVDGDEVAHGSDPSKANTDGDPVLDYEEVIRGSRPLVPDFLVTATITALEVEEDCDNEAAPGEFYWDLSIVKDSEIVARSLTGQREPDGRVFGIAIGDGERHVIGASATFGLSTTPGLYEEFILSGELFEEDDGRPSGEEFPVTYPADESDPSGRFPGPSIEQGFHRVAIATERRDFCKFSVVVTYNAR